QSRQKTPADKPYARRPEIIRTHKSPVRVWPVLWRFRSFLEIHIITPRLALERQRSCDSRRFPAWRVPRALDQLRNELRSPRRILIMARWREEAQRQHVRFVPPRVRPQHAREALRQQHRRN